MRWPVSYIPRSLSLSGSALRGVFSEAFRPTPTLYKSNIDLDLARSLYRNDNPNYTLGAGFVRPIIDLPVEYIGLPLVTSNDSDMTVWLNDCIHNFWGAQILEVYRDAMRDAKTVFRFRQPMIDNPLFTEEDRMHGRIEVVPPETVELEWNPADADMLDRAVIHHDIDFDERTLEEVTEGVAPRYTTHHILEIITPDRYRFFDASDNVYLTSWETANSSGFVPVWPAFNEYAADLAGGQSDIEPVMPFIQAFHDILLQALTAHRYHSTPKAKFNIKSVANFLKNNFPEVLDENGKLTPGAKVNWSGREIFFFESEEDGGFIEAKSVLGDSKTLLDFLIDCIAIASETPKWALLKESGSDKDASVETFAKKIWRKRVNFSMTIQMMCKMALTARSRSPETVKLVWPALRLSDLASKGQAIQQIVMALDTAKINGWVADETAIEILSALFPEINDPATEKRLAANNYEPPVQAPAPASATQGAQVAKSSNGNGGGTKSTATKAIRKALTS